MSPCTLHCGFFVVVQVLSVLLVMMTASPHPPFLPLFAFVCSFSRQHRVRVLPPARRRPQVRPGPWPVWLRVTGLTAGTAQASGGLPPWTWSPPRTSRPPLGYVRGSHWAVAPPGALCLEHFRWLALFCARRAVACALSGFPRARGTSSCTIVSRSLARLATSASMQLCLAAAPCMHVC